MARWRKRQCVLLQFCQWKLRAYDTQPVYCFAELSPGQILLGCAYGLLLMDKETGSLMSFYPVIRYMILL